MPFQERKCDSFGCNSLLPDSNKDPFCSRCKEDFSVRALELMRDYQKGIKDIIIDAARKFSSAQSIADYLGVSLPTLYTWIDKEFKLTYRQFSRKFVCTKPSNKCIVADFGASGYGWRYTLSDRIASRGGCSCFIEKRDDLLMTTLTPEGLSEAVSADPVLDKDTDIYHLRYPVKLPIITGNNDD